MPTLKCLSCDFEATTRTRTELIEKLTEHAAVHHVPALPDAVLANMRQAMRNSVTVTPLEPKPIPSHGSRLGKARTAPEVIGEH